MRNLSGANASSSEHTSSTAANSSSMRARAKESAAPLASLVPWPVRRALVTSISLGPTVLTRVTLIDRLPAECIVDLVTSSEPACRTMGISGGGGRDVIECHGYWR
jgi:hypothetical protein